MNQQPEPQHCSFQVTLAELVHHKRKLIDVPYDLSIRETLALMNKENLICIPVYGSPGKWISCGGFNVVVHGCQYIGLLSLADLLVFMTNEKSGYLDSNEIADRLNSLTAVEVLGSTAESQTLWMEPAHKTLSYTMERFAKGGHYLLAHDEKNVDRDVKILSQTDVIKYLHANASLIPVVKVTLNRPVGHFANTQVESVSESASMLVALELLRTVRAVPVLSRDGQLVSTLSLSDLRGYYRRPTDFTKIVNGVPKMTTVGEYLISCQNPMRAPITVAPTDPLSSALQKMIDHKVHRVWIYQEPTKFRSGLAGVVSMTDIIRAIYDADQKCISDSFHSSQVLKAGSTENTEKSIAQESSPNTTFKISGSSSLGRSHQNFDVCMSRPDKDEDSSEEGKRVL